MIQFDYVRFCSIIELTKSSVFDFVRLPNTIEFNRTIMFDYVRLCSIEILFDFVRLDTPGEWHFPIQLRNVPQASYASSRDHWCCVESTRLPPIHAFHAAGFDSPTRRHMWVMFVVSSFA